MNEFITGHVYKYCHWLLDWLASSQPVKSPLQRGCKPDPIDLSDNIRLHRCYDEKFQRAACIVTTISNSLPTHPSHRCPVFVAKDGFICIIIVTAQAWN